MPLFETVTDWNCQIDVLKRRRYGVIEAADGNLKAVRFRPYPKCVTLPEALWWGPRRHERWNADCCRLYFNQPLQHSNFLALTYCLSGRKTSLATIHIALNALDAIARIKSSDAILTDVQNFRIAGRWLERYGWAPHKPSRWRRHYIKRFYGNYPATASEPTHRASVDESLEAAGGVSHLARV